MRTPRSTIPAGVHELWLSEVDWAYETVPQAHAGDVGSPGRAAAFSAGRAASTR